MNAKFHKNKTPVNSVYLKVEVIPNYWYLEVNFLVPENLLSDISSLRYKELKWKLKQKMYPNNILWYKISVFYISKVDSIIKIK